MKFQPLTSDSNGNRQYIETKETKILVDAGMTGKEIQELLEEVQVDPEDLDGILMTHEHYDHTSAVGILTRRRGIKVFADEDTWMAMKKTVRIIPVGQREVFITGEGFHIKDFHVQTFPTFRDCVHETSFVLEDDRTEVSMLMDTGRASTSMMERVKGADPYYIEANHDGKMLRIGPYSFTLKQRIAPNRGHLSNHRTTDVLSKMLEKKNEHVILAHMSIDSSDPFLATRTFREDSALRNIHEGLHSTMEVTKEASPNDPFLGKEDQ